MAFRRTIEIDVVRHDDVSVTGNAQTIAGEAFALQHVHLFNENLRVDNATVADNRRDVIVHNARRNQMKRQLGIAVNNRVACVVSALITNNVIVVARNKVSDLAFALVAPLSAKENRAWHERSFRCFNN